MKPLSEKEIKKKIEEIITTDDYSHGIQLKTVDKMYDLILSDRKAWGEYVIGEDEPEPEIPVNDYYWRFRNELRAKQRQRNQGEKTDE